MAEFTTSEIFAAPPDRVFPALADRPNHPAADGDRRSCEKVSPGPIGAGTVFRETRTIAGNEVTGNLTVTRCEPNSRISFQTEAEGFILTYDYVLTPEGDGTRVAWTCTVDANGFRKVMVPVVATMVEEQDGGHLRALAHAVERDG